jgi:hypothetical protein
MRNKRLSTNESDIHKSENRLYTQGGEESQMLSEQAELKVRKEK